MTREKTLIAQPCPRASGSATLARILRLALTTTIALSLGIAACGGTAATTVAGSPTAHSAHARAAKPLAVSLAYRPLFSLPAPAAIARLEPADMRPWQYSRQKAEYLIGAARLITGGGLDLAALPAMSATRAERTLLAVRGLGPWSVNYLMMRSLGFADCVPIGDTGVTSGLQSLFRLEERPDADATRRLMSVFSPHRSLATAHLWQLNRPEP